MLIDHFWKSCVRAKSLQSCLTLCDPVNCSLPGFSVHGIPSKNSGVGCHALLQGICLLQGSNLHLKMWLNCYSLMINIKQMRSCKESNFLRWSFSWWRCCEDCWNDTKDLDINLVDKATSGFARTDSNFESSSFVGKCYQTALYATEKSFMKESVYEANVNIVLF